MQPSTPQSSHTTSPAKVLASAPHPHELVSKDANDGAALASRGLVVDVTVQLTPSIVNQSAD